MDKPSKLVVLCDGMWCSAETKTETNLRMLARIIGINFEKGENCLHGKSCQARYFAGPGLGSPFDFLVSGSVKDDITTRCIDVYEYVVNNFTERHELWMFGLGRGSYIIRCVAGMIEKCGIVRKAGVDHETALLIRCAYAMYANGNELKLPSDQISTFRSMSSWAVERPIKFIGILDTTSPRGFPHFLSVVKPTWPPLYDTDLPRVAEKVYHAVASHERLPFFDLCRLRQSDRQSDKEEQTHRFRNVHEKWFPGMHYDLGRQEFSLGLGGGIAERWSSWLPGQRIRPNAVISDLVLKWMLENIRTSDSSGSVIPDINHHIEELLRKLTSGTRSTGSGDIYDRIIDYTPLAPFSVAWNGLVNFSTRRVSDAIRYGQAWVLGVEDRQILDASAETYDYKRQFDQSGDTIERLAQLSRERYPSNAYMDFQLFRLQMGEINQGTYKCLVGNEHDLRRKWSGGLGGHIVLDINWQGPNFYKLHGEHWDRVLTITKANPSGEYYIARTISDFMSEFYGDLGVSLLHCVAGLCTFRTRVISKEMTEEGSPSASASKSPRTLDRVHLHVSEDSVTACFEEETFDWKISASSSDKMDRVLSALHWLVSVLQTSEDGSRGLFRVGCKVDDDNNWLSYCEPFESPKEESSCWTQLFDLAYIAEAPPSLKFDVMDRPEGLEIDFDQLLDLTDASRSWSTDSDITLFGPDIALVQLKPVETRRWHVVSRPGKLISPLDTPFCGSLQDFESGSIRNTTESPNISLRGAKTGAIKSSIGQRVSNREQKSENFTYPAGKVYVGWCSDPCVTIGTEKPSPEFLEKFDQQTNVPEVTNDIVSLANVNRTDVITVGAKLGFMGNTVSLDRSHQRGEQKVVEPRAISYHFRLHFGSQLRSIERTPCILWDDTTERAWLVPGSCALLFISLCYFERLGLSFNKDIQYAPPSKSGGESATRCLEENQGLLLTNAEYASRGTSFGHLVGEVWDGMGKANAVCFSTTNKMKHIRPGFVFGYDLYDLLGSGWVTLRYLDETRAGANLRGWEPLARLQNVHVIFCRSVGQVIKCASRECPGAPCQEFCSSANGSRGVLACLLKDFKRFFSQDWNRYPESGTLLVRYGFEWVPKGPDLFEHKSSRRHVAGLACQCCAQLDRLQSVVPVRREPTVKRWLRNWLVGRRQYFNTMWLEQDLAVRFGLHRSA